MSLFYIESNMVCLVFFLLLFIRSLKGVDRQDKQRVFDVIIVCHIFYFTSDIIWAFFVSDIIETPIFLMILLNILNHMILGALACFWFIYIEIDQGARYINMSSRRYWVIIPVFVSSFIMMGLYIFKTRLLLNEDGSNTGLYNFLFLFVPVSYVICASARSVIRACRKEHYADRYLFLVHAAYPPIVALMGIFQMIFLAVPIFCFGCTITMFYVYLISMDSLVSMDPLTGLNNRAQLKRYVASEASDNQSYYVLMLDLNNFKYINDKFGHVEGDTAIKRAASALKRACSDDELRPFAARYGGDEFIVIVRTNDEQKVKEFKSRILWFLDNLNRKAEAPYEISTSIGYAEYDGNTSHFEDAVSRADKNLYSEKQSLKAENSK